MELSISFFIGICIILVLSLLGYCCLRFYVKNKKEHTVLYKRSTSLQNSDRPTENAVITRTFRYSLREGEPTSLYPQNPPYPVNNVPPYPSQPPPIGFGLMPAYEATSSIVHPIIHMPSPNVCSQGNTNANARPPYPLDGTPFPPVLPPSYDEVVRQSAQLRS
ncbi:hypothetical protein FQA39_LY03402 [Lamprigera yunnana]|nr:hypothetical protein FQA39_LY03401 [Lamprigera yunnana]KAF5292368.1 hypothetical protein FQA39_LY03402 [Lamprigera yunnana]